jgi:hypothetical protein
MNYRELRETEKVISEERTKEMMTIKEDLCSLFFKPIEKRSDINILPADDPLRGIKGYILWRKDDSTEISTNVQIRIGKIVAVPMNKAYKSKEEFDKAFYDAWESEKPMYVYDDPIRELCGFIVESRNSRMWHHIPLSLLEETVSKPMGAN